MRLLALRQAYDIKTEKVDGQLLSQEVRAIGSAQDAMTEQIASQDEEKQRQWILFVEATTRESIKRLQDAGIPTVIVTQVKCKKSSQKVTLDDSSLAAWCDQLISNKVMVLPMKCIFTPDQAGTLFMDSTHVLPAGDQLIAKSLISLLKEKAWFPHPM